MDIYTHKHHIIPRHAGGTDDHDNLIDLTVEDHAIAHRMLWKLYGRWQDEVAWRMLSGQINGQEATKEAQRNGQIDRWSKEGAREKQRQKYLGENNPMYGKKQTDKQKEAVRVANSVPKPYVAEAQRKAYSEGKSNLCNRVGADNGMSRVVLVGDQRYDTVTQAAEAHGVSRVTARRRLTVDTFPDWNYE